LFLLTRGFLGIWVGLAMVGGLGEQGPWIPVELGGLAVGIAERVGGRAVAYGSAVNDGGDSVFCGA
jgi:hypothetical protein